MRLKTLRKAQPVFETEGALVRGNRINLSNNELRSPRHPTLHDDDDDGEHSPPPPTEVASIPADPATEMLSNQQQQLTETLTIPDASSQTTDLTSYQAIEAAYLERGIRIRLSPNKSTANAAAASGRRSASSQRQTPFAYRNPSRTSSVLHYAPTRPELDQETRSFSVLQQASSNGFETSQQLNVSLAPSSTQFVETTNPSEYFSPSLIATEYSNPVTPPEKGLTHQPAAISLTFPNDPDLAYMSSLLKTSIGQSYREAIRRRAGLRDTFAVHRHPVFGPTAHLPTSREKSPSMLRPSAQRSATMSVAPSSPSPEKIDKDIIKHASRLRLSHMKELPRRSPALETTPRINSSKSHLINRPSQKNFKSISLEPLELLLSQPFPRSSSSTHRTKSGQSSFVEHSHTGFGPLKPLPSNSVRQSSSFDSGYYDQSSNGGDFQSLTSSSLMQTAHALPAARLTSSTTRRSNATKKVSFYEEPTATILRTTTTYV